MVLVRDGIQTLTTTYDMCLLGSDGVGKSTLIVQYVYDSFIPDIQDVDVLYTKRVITPDTLGNYQEITIFETDYHKDLYSDSRKRQIFNANTLVLVYSIDNLRSFLDLEDYYSNIVQLRGPCNIPPICLIGTKFDLESVNREVSYSEAAAFAKKINAVSFHECSAKEAFAVKDAFQRIANLAVKIRLDNYNRERSNSAITDDQLGIPSSNGLALFETYDSSRSEQPLPVAIQKNIQDHKHSSQIQEEKQHQHQLQHQQNHNHNQIQVQTRSIQQTSDQEKSFNTIDNNNSPLQRSPNSKLSLTLSTTKKIRNPVQTKRSRSIESQTNKTRVKDGCCIIT